MLQIFDNDTGRFIGVSYSEDKDSIRQYHAESNQGSIWTTEDVIESETITVIEEDFGGNIHKTNSTVIVYKELSLNLLKDNKISKFNISKEYNLNDVIFSINRSDILKYKEATDIAEGRELDVVKLNTLTGVISISITEARNVVKTLSEKAVDDYWLEQDFINDVNASTTIEELNAVGM